MNVQPVLFLVKVRAVEQPYFGSAQAVPVGDQEQGAVAAALHRGEEPAPLVNGQELYPFHSPGAVGFSVFLFFTSRGFRFIGQGGERIIRTAPARAGAGSVAIRCGGGLCVLCCRQRRAMNDIQLRALFVADLHELRRGIADENLIGALAYITPQVRKAAIVLLGVFRTQHDVCFAGRLAFPEKGRFAVGVGLHRFNLTKYVFC